KLKKETVVSLHPDFESSADMQRAFELLKRAPKQEQAFLAFISLSKKEDWVKRKEVQKKAGVSSSVVNSLVTKGILKKDKKAIDRLSRKIKNVEASFEFNPLQEQAYQEILTEFDKKQSVLLHG